MENENYDFNLCKLGSHESKHFLIFKCKFFLLRFICDFYYMLRKHKL